MSGYSKMDSTDKNPNPVNLQTQKPDQEPAEMKPRLSRNRSVAASGQVFHSPMKSVMSMRRSSSVSDQRYCRIYDQSSTTFPLPFNEEEEDEYEDDDKERMHKKKKSNKIKKKAFVKACKRFFGIS
ncbi:uncharacterized protein LOC130506817 [Raphanus sativus]|uniref:Uncharacterized protein LOC108853448 n=1 Tax=Raphanus sativus TaxID=3726 RepID=A0A6J0NCV2_RAPSA|nr:uncharacterized protein LOC108853448 [Raphanus sativus]XP_056857488.1 uncharacterized protein LOC130506817 [Raphanus sativus]